MDIYVKFTMTTHKIWPCHVTMVSNSESFYFFGCKYRCKYCSFSNKYLRCPTYNKICKNCHKKNHSKAARKAGKAKSVKHIVAKSSSSDSESEDEEEFFIG